LTSAFGDATVDRRPSVEPAPRAPAEVAARPVVGATFADGREGGSLVRLASGFTAAIDERRRADRAEHAASRGSPSLRWIKPIAIAQWTAQASGGKIDPSASVAARVRALAR
jgi:hypothetical protein